MTLKVCVMCTHEKFVEVHQSSANMAKIFPWDETR